MPEVEHKSLLQPDETRSFPNGNAAVINFAGGKVGRTTVLPGWRWSTDVKPIAKTDTCQDVHILYIESGGLHVVLADGKEYDLRAGEVCIIPPGHDAWVVGNEPCVNIDWGGMERFAKP